MRERLINLLHQILQSNFPLSIKQLEQTYNVSSRTLRTDIAEINEYLEDHKLPQLQTIRGKGISHFFSISEVQVLNDYLQLELKEEYLTREERLLDILLSISFGENSTFLYKKESEYLVSKSTIDEDMRILRQKLSNFNVGIVSVPKLGLQLSGSESSIRTMLYTLIGREIASSSSTYFKVITKHFPKSMIETLNLFFDEFIGKKEESLHKLHFNLFTGIWILRVKRGFYVARSDVPTAEKLVEHDNIEKFILQICKQFELIPIASEFDYVYRILTSFNIEKNNSPVNWLQLQILTLDLIKYVEAGTGIPFSTKEGTLQQMLYNHIISMVTRIDNDVQLTNPLKDKIEYSYGIIYQKVKEFSIEIEKLVGKQIIDDEIAFLTIHFSTVLSEINQENIFSFRAVVICNHGIATGRLLAENLKEYFNIEVFAILSSSDISLVDKLDIDLIFSTVELNYAGKPVMVLESIIQEETKLRIQSFLNMHSDVRRVTRRREEFTSLFRKVIELTQTVGRVTETIYSEFEELFKEYDLRVNKREMQPMIQDLLLDDYIVLTDKTFDWRESIKFVAQPLLSDSIITESYVDAMIRSVEEYGPYIVIGPKLALAHARPEDGAEKLGLSLAIFEKAVSFGEEEGQQVQVAFCLSAIDSFSHLEVMKSLVNLIREKGKIDLLASARDKETVKQILFNI
ncbi:TPA: transcription antiterminator [Streptococcus suis]|nr:transcription antiterminator [Streptococcus suis]